MDPFKRLEQMLWGEASAAGAGQGPETGETPLIGQSAVKDPKWNTRYRQLLALASNVAALGYGPIPLPAIALNEFRDEDYFPNEPLAWGQDRVPQAAFFRSEILLWNPSGSNTLVIARNAECVVQRLDTAGAVEVMLLEQVPGGLFAPVVLGFAQVPGTLRARDLRFDAPGVTTWVPQAQIWEAQQAALVVTPLFRVYAGASQAPATLPPFVLQPGTGLMFQPDIDNEGLTCSFAWRERVLVV
jgi:hypothetical protein